MRILVTNDDGINAKGIHVLERIAAEVSDDVWVVAPLHEQSAVSRAITLHNPLHIKHVGKRQSERRYAVTGTPSDSVILALREVMKDNPPDLVLSGVNRGQNLAEDVTYSGTVAGAKQGTSMGIPSIALSLAKGFQGSTDLPWETAEAHGPDLIRSLLKAGWPKRVTVNVNFPDRAPDNVEGIKVTRQGFRDHDMNYLDKRDNPRGGSYYWLRYGGPLSQPSEGTDLRAIYDGYISVTPLMPDLTHFETLADLQGAF